jgi:glycosyltransferase involved in cell wall biosynthesis
LGRILFVGDPEDRNKGFRYLLMALRDLTPTCDFHLLVVQRSWSKRTEQEAAEFGLGDRVTFLDSLSQAELVCAYNQSQMLISPSLYEGFGLPVAEAMACGTPVVATRVGASPEVIEDGVSGILVAPGEAASLATAIRTLLQDPARCHQMGTAGIERVRERFSWRRAAEETADLYEDVLGQRRALRMSQTR